MAGEADRLLRISGSPRLPNGVGIDVQRIATVTCRFDVAEVPDLNLGGAVLGAFIAQFDLILLKENCPMTRKRFSLAHELGHAQIERAYGNGMSLFSLPSGTFFRCDEADIGSDDIAKGSRPRTEVLANKFAALLLMPEALLRSTWSRKKSIADVASIFEVSRQSLEIRLAELRLIDVADHTKD